MKLRGVLSEAGLRSRGWSGKTPGRREGGEWKLASALVSQPRAESSSLSNDGVWLQVTGNL